MGLLQKFVHATAMACGWALLSLCALTAYDIVARRLFGHSVQGVDELGGYVLAITAAIGFGVALMNRMHTRIDLIIVQFSRPVQAGANAVAALALAGFAVFIVQKAWTTVAETIEFGSRASTPLQTPLWIPQSIWLFGLALFAVIACAMAGHALLLLARREWDTANRLYGPPTLEEETEASLAAVGPLSSRDGDL